MKSSLGFNRNRGSVVAPRFCTRCHRKFTPRAEFRVDWEKRKLCDECEHRAAMASGFGGCDFGLDELGRAVKKFLGW